MNRDESERTDDDHRVTVLVAFACGLVTGAALGTLFAPAPGRDTRTKVRRGATAAADHTRSLVREQRERLHAFIKRHGVLGLLRQRPEEIAGEISGPSGDVPSTLPRLGTTSPVEAG